MITLIDIQNAVSKSISDNIKEEAYIYVEEVKDGLKRPAFFIEVLPVKTDNYLNHLSKLILVEIMYLCKDKTMKENLEMANMLENIFNLSMTVKDRRLTVNTLNYEIVNDILRCSFTLEFDDNIDLIEVKTKNGVNYLPEYQLSEKLGYTKDNIEEMEKLEIE